MFCSDRRCAMCSQMGYVSMVVHVARQLCDGETEGAALSDKSWLQVTLATLDFALPQTCGVSRVAVTVEAGATYVQEACAMAVGMLQQLRSWLLSRPAPLKPRAVAELLLKGRLLRWWACLEHLGRPGGVEVAAQVASLLLAAVTSGDLPMSGGGAIELGISPAEASEVRAQPPAAYDGGLNCWQNQRKCHPLTAYGGLNCWQNQRKCHPLTAGKVQQGGRIAGGSVRAAPPPACGACDDAKGMVCCSLWVCPGCLDCLQ
jgi:hypothetical protein